MELITKTSSTFINWVDLFIWSKTYSTSVNYGKGMRPWCLSVDFFGHLIFCELCFWAWWFQPYCGLGSHAGWSFSWSSSGAFLFASVIPSGHTGRFLHGSSLPGITVPFLGLFKLLLHCGSNTCLVLRGFLSHLSSHPFHFISSFPSLSALLPFLHLPSLHFPGCPAPAWLQQKAMLSPVSSIWPGALQSKPALSLAWFFDLTLFLLPAFPILGWTSIMPSKWPPVAIKCVIYGRSQCKVLSV